MDLDWKDSRGSSQLLHPLRASQGTSTHGPCCPAPGEELGPVGHGSLRPARPAGRRHYPSAAVGRAWGASWGVSLVGRFVVASGCRPSPHVTSRDAGETRSQSSRERRLCHCSTAVRCALSMRRQWLDSGAPVEYCPITILPMKSLLLFTLCPYTGESRNTDWSRQKHRWPSQSPAPGHQMSYRCPPTAGARCQHFWYVTQHLKNVKRNRSLEGINKLYYRLKYNSNKQIHSYHGIYHE